MQHCTSPRTETRAGADAAVVQVQSRDRRSRMPPTLRFNERGDALEGAVKSRPEQCVDRAPLRRPAADHNMFLQLNVSAEADKSQTHVKAVTWASKTKVALFLLGKTQIYS